MNDRIAQMAREAGFPAMAVDNLSEADRDRLTAFARLVAEDCAEIADEMAGIYWDGDGASSAEQVSRDIRDRYK